LSHKLLKFLIYGCLAMMILGAAGCASIPIPGEIPIPNPFVLLGLG